MAHFRQFTAIFWCIVLTGCTHMGYYVHTTRGQLDVLGRRESIETLLPDESVDPQLKEKLKQSLEIREFATQQLGLPDNDSYRSYADVERPFVVWSVVATPEFSVDPKQWCFLFVGCVTYRGYFSEEKARAFAARLEGDGFDVAVRGVSAYSTLGTFDDPVLNTMLHWDETQLAGIIFHELAHQQIYIKGDTAFNEAFATVVQEEGVRQWLVASSSDPDSALAAYAVQRENSRIFAELIATTRDELRVVYNSDKTADELSRAKAQALLSLRNRYEQAKQVGLSGYDRWFAQDLNNAHLAAAASYFDLVPAFQALLLSVDGHLQVFYQQAEAIAELDADSRRQELQALEPAVKE